MNQETTNDDLCGDCSNPANDRGQDGHIDNWSADVPNCAFGADDFGNFKTFKIID